MKLLTSRMAGYLAPVLAITLSACGQKPSFADKESTKTNVPGQGVGGEADSGPGDAVGKHDGGGGGGADSGNDAGGVDGAGNDGGGVDGGGSGKGPNGEDPTTGDKEPGSEGGKDGDVKLPGGNDSDDLPGDDKDRPRPKKTTEMDFPAQSTMDSSLTKTLDGAYLTSEITLQRTYNAKTKQVKQVVRPPMVDTFDQGNSGASNTEVFNQVADRPLDIVLVIDTSNSMKEEQDNMAGKLAPLLASIADSDWQIGVVTTDPNDGALRKLIKKGDADYMTAFAKAVTAGTNGSNNERSVLQAVRSMAGYNLSQPWIRPDSTIAVLIVSDEDNCSNGSMNNGGDCPGKDYAKSDYLVNYLASIRQVGKNARTYGIIWGPNQNQTQCPTGYNQGIVLADAIARTQGIYGSICDDDYTSTLNAISKNVATVLASRFTLKYMPDPGSVRVFVDTTELPSTAFTVMGNVVEVNPAPADKTKITITYKYGASPIKKSFALRYAPYAGSVSVTVDGAPTNDYTVNYAAPSIDFATAPAERAKIVVNYLRDVPLTTVFQLGDNIKPGTLSVMVNGMATADYTVQEPIGTVTFNTAPAAGATVDFAYTAVGNPVYTYPFSAPYGTPQDLVAYDSNTMAPVRVLYVLGTVTVNALDYAEGRRVTLRYDNVARQSFSVELPQDPIPGKVKATGGNVVCATAPYLQVVGRMVDVNGCNFADDTTAVRFDYSYVVATYQDFDFKADKLPGANDYQVWTVWVNGVATTDYVRTGAHFHLDQALPLGAVVKIQLIQYAY